MIIHPTPKLLACLTYILYTTASTSNQIDNACSATGKRLFTQHFIGPTSDGTCETAASLRGKLSIYDIQDKRSDQALNNGRICGLQMCSDSVR